MAIRDDGADAGLQRWRGNTPGPTALELGKAHPLIVALSEAGVPDDEIAWKLSAHTAGHVAAAYLASWFNAFDPLNGELLGSPNRGGITGAIREHAGGWALEPVRKALAKLPARYRINEPERSAVAVQVTLDIVAYAVKLVKAREATSANTRNAIRNPAGVLLSILKSGEAFGMMVDELHARLERKVLGEPERTRLAIQAAPVVTDQAACEFRVRIQDIADSELAALWAESIKSFKPGSLEFRNYTRVMFQGAQLRESILASGKARALLDAVLTAGKTGRSVSHG